MPSSHLPLAPCDKWVYDFPYDFIAIVGGYGTCVHIVQGSCNFFYGHSKVGRGKAVQRLRGDSTEIVQIWCCRRAVSAWKAYGAHASSVKRLRGDGAVTVQSPCRI